MSSWLSMLSPTSKRPKSFNIWSLSCQNPSLISRYSTSRGKSVSWRRSTRFRGRSTNEDAYEVQISWRTTSNLSMKFSSKSIWERTSTTSRDSSTPAAKRLTIRKVLAKVDRSTILSDKTRATTVATISQMEELRQIKNLWGLSIEPIRVLTTNLETLRPTIADGSKMTRLLHTSKMAKSRLSKARSQCSTTMRKELIEPSTTRGLKEIRMTLIIIALIVISKLTVLKSLLLPKTRASIWFQLSRSLCLPTTRIQSLILLIRGRSTLQNL